MATVRTGGNRGRGGGRLGIGGSNRERLHGCLSTGTDAEQRGQGRVFITPFFSRHLLSAVVLR